MAGAADMAVFREHGGRLAAAAARFPGAPSPWIDLSTGINPRPYPAPAPPRAALGRLPDPADLAAMEAAAAAAFGATPDKVAAVPGSEAAIRLLPRILGAESVAVARGAYGGHADAWRHVARAAPSAADARVVVNPDNPTGKLTAAAEILASAERRWTIVDEAFVECVPAASVAAQVGGPLIVLRSFGKFYGLPGLRLGFVVAAPEIIAEVRAAFGDWPVSVAAILAAQAAYADDAWAARTRRRLDREAAALDALLTDAGFSVVGGTSLFRLAHRRGADALFVSLAEAGILCRPFADPDRLRFGLPADAAAWARLQAALGARA